MYNLYVKSEDCSLEQICATLDNIHLVLTQRQVQSALVNSSTGN